MKVLVINKSFRFGGAGIASTRLYQALRKKGMDVSMLVFDNVATNDSNVVGLTNGTSGRVKHLIYSIVERLYFLFYEKSKSIRFLFSPAIWGIDVTKYSVFKEADIIHLHWINHGFLSIRSLRKIIASGKPVVITLHDFWYFTGGCHLPMECVNYKQRCGECIYIKNAGPKDLSAKGYLRKENLYKDHDIRFIACSNWIRNKAKSSGLLSGFRVDRIPNPINTEVFALGNRKQSRKYLGLSSDKNLILFGAAKAVNKNKGYSILLETCNYLREQYPYLASNLELIIVGKSNESLDNVFPFRTHYLGMINDDETMARIYQAADLFILPTLIDNLPNMVMESLSCGVPVVSFDVGGVPELINHKENGYLAEFKSVKDLSDGVVWLLENNQNNNLGLNAREKVINEFSEDIVANTHEELYKSLLGQ